VVTAAFYDRSGLASYHRAVNPLYVLIEATASIFFIGAALAALRRGRLPFLELLSAAAFGILLEEGDQLVFETYHYSSDWILAISLDLAFDAIAIRMGLWTWRGIGPTDGWFGVPAGNFYSWLFVTLAFSSLTRWLRQAAVGRPTSSYGRPSGSWRRLASERAPECRPSRGGAAG
jgi:hypothetical protein